MSFVDVRPYFRKVIKEADAKLVEWNDAFNEDNIPKTIIDKRCFHILVGKFKVVNIDQPRFIQFSGDATITLYYPAAKNLPQNVDDIIAKGQAIVERAMMAKNRVTQPSIKSVQVINFDPSPMSRSNDNAVRLTIDFSLVIVLELPTV